MNYKLYFPDFRVSFSDVILFAAIGAIHFAGVWQVAVFQTLSQPEKAVIALGVTGIVIAANLTCWFPRQRMQQVASIVLSEILCVALFSLIAFSM